MPFALVQRASHFSLLPVTTIFRRSTLPLQHSMLCCQRPFHRTASASPMRIVALLVPARNDPVVVCTPFRRCTFLHRSHWPMNQTGFETGAFGVAVFVISGAFIPL